ncbi:MAG: 50S ribosomal protein L29 [Planctomycetes bacterium]|jgi:large subunit ribosomal protein L29|nr:50S ribosomal protein L29 [Planctomycetota bacterium]HIG87864.1 50S ribosomal protein L29 [Planctomycetota bacterium]HIL36514.1 50S ribosomal protein L29 [Planctomycetota bacterium]
MKIEEVRSKKDAELEFDLASLNKELHDLRFKSATGNMQSPSSIRMVRRSVARIKTVMAERVQGIRDQEPQQ